MSPESIVRSMLTADGVVTGYVGTRIAVGEFVQRPAYPALLLTVVSRRPEPEVAYQRGPQRMRVRVQIDAIAPDLPTVEDVHAAVRACLDFRHRETVEGCFVLSCRLMEGATPPLRNPALGVWSRPADYSLMFYE